MQPTKQLIRMTSHQPDFCKLYTKPFQLPPLLAPILLGIVAALAFFAPSNVKAQSDSEPIAEREYVGTQECAACHRDLTEFHVDTAHAQALNNIQTDKTSLLADFSQNTDIRTLLFPGEDTARPFTADDISYAIGSGKYTQRYLYALNDNTFMVFPAEWNVLEEKWQPFILGETWPDSAYNWTTQCAYCHTTNLNLEQNTWAEDGVQCEACHGPGSVHLDAGEANDRILTKRKRTALESSIELGLDPATCGQCHSRGTGAAHGNPFPTDYQPGDPLLDRETFDLVSIRSAVHWWSTGQASQPNMQFNEWVTTVHAEAFLTVAQHPDFTPGCLTCHNSTFSRAVQIANRIEAEDDRERIDILFDEADLRVDGIYEIDWDTLKALTLAELGLTTETIEDTEPFLPQILPYLIERMNAEDELVDGQILPQSLATVMHIAFEGTNDDHIMRSLGVTCATCHNLHSPAGYPASLASDTDTLCTACHRSAEPFYGLHHPVREVFEGRSLIAEVNGIASAHFSADNGPTCATCHMPPVPVEDAQRVSHTLNPILPSSAIDIEGIEDSCISCHGEQIAGQSMQELIASIQQDARTRHAIIRAAITTDSPAWISDTLQIIAGDGSWGLHNYAYTSALLSRAERELGLSEDVAPLVLPDIPVQPPPQSVESPTQTTVSVSGLTPPSIILLAIASGLILISAYLFLVRGRDS